MNKNHDKVLDRRFIEEAFPIREVSLETTKEKNIRHGNISALHIWWARKPLGASRAICYASLIPAPANQNEFLQTKDTVVRLSKFGNSLNETVLANARLAILGANNGVRPRVLDPFAGGGSIPFEALRMGCEVYASDYNPVATLVLKCTLEFPQKYGGREEASGIGLSSSSRPNILFKEVKRWGKRILEETERDLGRFYPSDEDGSIPVAYVWARTIPCQNPSCAARLPLLPQFWLSKEGNAGISLLPYVDRKTVRFRIGTVGGKHSAGFDPSVGSVSRAIATCLVCGSMIDGRKTSELFRTGQASEQLVAVILHKPGTTGKKYRLATATDMEVFQQADRQLRETAKALSDEWGLSAVPDEPLPLKDTHRAVGSQLPLYNFKSFGDLFNPRQKLALLTFVAKVREAHGTMLREGYDEDFGRAVLSYLALGIDKLADFGSSLCTLNQTGGRGVAHTFVRPVLQMVWTYAESNPFNPSGAGWITACEKNEEWIDHASKVNPLPAVVRQASATSVPYPADFFDAIFTDPPYYDNVPYSYLSDFFYVWLKRSIGPLFPELFATPLSPKSDEIGAYSNSPVGPEVRQFFEERLGRSFSEMHRVLKPNGLVAIVYAHKSTAGWETLINSLLGTGLVVRGAWPIHTEKEGRLNSRETAALASSTYMVARKAKREPIGFYKEVRQELREHLTTRLNNLWKEQISGADFFISAIGSSIEIFGKYERVIDDEGQIIDAAKLLSDVRSIVTDYAVRQVLHSEFVGEISAMTRFYLLWRWAYGEARLEYDDAKKLAQGVGIDLQKEWNSGFIRKDKEYVEVLSSEDRESLEPDSKELIDVLHNVLSLWKIGKYEEILNLLKETGLGKSEVFYRVAEAISQSLPNSSKEKKLLEGFLQGRGRISEDIRRHSQQMKLNE